MFKYYSGIRIPVQGIYNVYIRIILFRSEFPTGLEETVNSRGGQVKPSSRILIIFGVVLVLLVVITVVLVLALGQRSVPLLPENTPEGTIQRYLQAVQDRDYQKAYGFLTVSPLPTGIPGGSNLPDYDFWLRSAEHANTLSWRVILGNSWIRGNNATVDITAEVFSFQGPFSNPVRRINMTFSLIRKDSLWLITSPLDMWWIY